MNFFVEMWAVIAASALGWLSNIDNNLLNNAVNLLTLLVILLGLVDWLFRKIHGVVKEKKKNNGRQVLDLLESTQKPFKTVNMLENPMGTSEKIVNLVDKISKNLGGKKMKKFFKWIWYNKEQLLSIAYQVVLLALANIVLFTDTFNALITIYFGVPMPIWLKIVIVIVALALTVLSVRNVVVKYGLSSLETIDKVLEERVTAKANKLDPEQKQLYKNYVSTLNKTLSTVKKEVQSLEEEFTKLTLLYNADSSLVIDYTNRTVQYRSKIAAGKETISNLETKITHYKALLSGQKTEQ